MQIDERSTKLFKEKADQGNAHISPCCLIMDILLVLGLNVVAIIIVWLISRSRNVAPQSEGVVSQEDYSELEATLKHREEELKESANNLIKLHEQLSSRDEKISELQSMLKQRDEVEKDRQEQVLELSKSNSKLGSECASSKQRVEELLAKVAEYETLNKSNIAQLQNKSESNAALEEQLSARNSKVAELQKSVDEYKATCNDQQDKLQIITKSNVTIEEQLSISKKRVEEYQAQIEEYKATKEQLLTRLQNLEKSNASQEEQLNSRDKEIKDLQLIIEEQKGAEEKLENRLKVQFELISNKIIEESRKKVSEFNAENISTLMQPFEKEIKEFKEQISTANKEQIRERTELEIKIKEMVTISQGMSTEAKNLSNALRGNNKAAGNWGETILENILQNSGLTAGREGYELQEMLRDEEGNAYRNDTGRKMIPDAIVHFPDNRNVIIDSKVSISAYTDYCNAENEEDKKTHIKRHLASIKSHIDSLNVKSYESYVDGSLDFVMMFIPNDFAAMVALQEDLNLWQNAYNKKILIISPTNLITSLKIVSDLWSREKQHQNVEKILERGRLLFDKCCTFVDSFKKIGDGLQGVVKIYSNASTQLGAESGIIRQAEMLVESGIKSKKVLALRSETAKKQAELLVVNDSINPVTNDEDNQ